MADLTDPADAAGRDAPASTPPEATGTPAEAADAPVDVQETAETAPENDSTAPPEIRKLRKESANYRGRLRETEAERDGLNARVQALEQVAVIRAGRDAGLRPEAHDDLLGLVDVDQLRDEHGNLDPDRMHAAIADAAQAKPYLFDRSGSYPPMPHGTMPPPAKEPADPWAGALKAAATNRR